MADSSSSAAGNSPAEMRQRIAEGGSARLTAAEIRQKVTAGGGFLRGFKPQPNYDYANDTDEDLLPKGALPEHRPAFNPLWSAYRRQTQTTNGFELYDYPGPSMRASLVPFMKFNTGTPEAELVVVELANRAIQEYNEKECNVFKYKFLKIETVNRRLTGYEEYFMTVKVLNLTLVTPIETFQVHTGKRMGDGFIAVFCCRPKEELNSS